MGRVAGGRGERKKQVAMKTLFLRIENWLLIILTVLLAIEKIFFSTAAFDLHLHDTYFIISSFHIGIGVSVILILPYLCHFLLRLQHKRNRNVLTSHVIATIILLLLLFIAVKQNADAPRRYYDFSNWESAQQFEGLNDYLTIAVLAFIIIQMLFVLYTLVRLMIKNKFSQAASVK